MKHSSSPGKRYRLPMEQTAKAHSPPARPPKLPEENDNNVIATKMSDSSLQGDSLSQASKNLLNSCHQERFPRCKEASSMAPIVYQERVRRRASSISFTRPRRVPQGTPSAESRFYAVDHALLIKPEARLPAGLASPTTSSPPVQSPTYPASVSKCVGEML